MKITVCGSTAFYPQIEEIKSQLEDLGHEVVIPLLPKEVPPDMTGGRKAYFGQYIEDNGGIDAFSQDHSIWDIKEDAIRSHFEKIDWGEVILVVNHNKRGIEGYIGGNTLIEIGMAFYTGKKIYILNPISSELSYKQEIYGMRPIILSGDLLKIG